MGLQSVKPAPSSGSTPLWCVTHGALSSVSPSRWPHEDRRATQLCPLSTGVVGPVNLPCVKKLGLHPSRQGTRPIHSACFGKSGWGWQSNKYQSCFWFQTHSWVHFLLKYNQAPSWLHFVSDCIINMLLFKKLFCIVTSELCWWYRIWNSNRVWFFVFICTQAGFSLQRSQKNDLRSVMLLEANAKVKDIAISRERILLKDEFQ